MELQPRQISDLALLTRALNSSTVDLENLSRRLVFDIDQAVSSVVSVTLTMTIDGEHFEVAASTKGGDSYAAASSLRFTLASQSSARAVGHLLILSETPGALVDFAADVGSALGLAGDSVALDDHIREPDENDVTATKIERTLSGGSEMNQAVGVLVEGGRTPTEGRAEMHRLAARSGAPVIEVARRVLRDALGWHPPTAVMDFS